MEFVLILPLPAERKRAAVRGETLWRDSAGVGRFGSFSFFLSGSWRGLTDGGWIIVAYGGRIGAGAARVGTFNAFEICLDAVAVGGGATDFRTAGLRGCKPLCFRLVASSLNTGRPR